MLNIFLYPFYFCTSPLLLEIICAFIYNNNSQYLYKQTKCIYEMQQLMHAYMKHIYTNKIIKLYHEILY
jgi:hypothetical protein